MFTDLSENEQKEFQALINKLLASNYLIKEKDRKSYYFIQRHKLKFEQFFRFLGWDFVLDDRHETVFISSPRASHRRTLTKEESIWMLIVKMIYQEKRESLSLSDFPVTSLYEIKQKYEVFRLPTVNKTKLTEYIRLCQHYQLMEPIDSNWHSQDARFLLYHSWLHMMDSTSMDKLIQKIQLYETTAGGDLLDEMDEEAQTS